MIDPTHKEFGEMIKKTSLVSSDKKTCADCGTTKTPLWRGGPAGPKSLCNACGIRSRKKRRGVLGTNKEGDKKGKNIKLGDSLKERLYALGRSSVHKHKKNKLGEEEQAAVLLMALSCGSVYG